MFGKKGQADNAVITSMILILVVAVVGIVGVTVYDSIEDSLGSDLLEKHWLRKITSQPMYTMVTTWLATSL